MYLALRKPHRPCACSTQTGRNRGTTYRRKLKASSPSLITAPPPPYVARMQNNGKFVVFNRKGRALWST